MHHGFVMHKSFESQFNFLLWWDNRPVDKERTADVVYPDVSKVFDNFFHTMFLEAN